MLVKLGISLVCFLVLLGNACDSKSGAGQNPAQPAGSLSNPANVKAEAKPEPAVTASGARLSDTCALIDKSDIASVQGAPVQSVVPSSQISGALAITQCYYTVFSADGSKNLSVHLEVTQNDPKTPNQNAISDLWREKFQGAKETKKMEKPKPVDGLGDGAYWVGNNKIGALYFLKKDLLVRVSVGGPDEAGMKIQKSRTLAEKVLARLK